jgi:DNA-directed RNA polymerase subunit RPC12/RpoP
MACPDCGCKETYQYGDSDILEKCANCGKIFDVDYEGVDEED